MAISAMSAHLATPIGPMPFKISTWNINSVRLRAELVAGFLADENPDVLCLQETKTPNEQFPARIFAGLGYVHQAFVGAKGYNGVAILSRHAFEAEERRAMCGREDARHIAVTLASGPARGVRIQNFYVPAGGDVADPDVNDKFRHKLDFLADMDRWAGDTQATTRPTILVGDLNIAPYEHDVWSHKQLLDVVSHTPIETTTLERLRADHGFVDAIRHLTPEPAKIYTWWSYRAQDWEASDRGRRLDHVWLSPDLAGVLSGGSILRAARGWERPSDHVPVTVTLDLQP
jgi:exodeoxyribonuclease-3